MSALIGTILIVSLAGLCRTEGWRTVNFMVQFPSNLIIISLVTSDSVNFLYLYVLVVLNCHQLMASPELDRKTSLPASCNIEYAECLVSCKYWYSRYSSLQMLYKKTHYHLSPALLSNRATDMIK